MSELPDHHVIVKFGKGIPADAQGRAMLAFEKHLRDIGAGPCEVFKDAMGDDSKLRRAMTQEQRNRL